MNDFTIMDIRISFYLIFGLIILEKKIIPKGNIDLNEKYQAQ
jgi:hypothetical protein